MVISSRVIVFIGIIVIWLVMYFKNNKYPGHRRTLPLLLSGFVALVGKSNFELFGATVNIPIWLLCFIVLLFYRKELSSFYITKNGALSGFILGFGSGLILSVFVTILMSPVNMPYSSTITNFYFVMLNLIIISIEEEILFRGLLLGSLQKAGIGASISLIVQSFLFASGHIQYIYQDSWLFIMAVFLLGFFSSVLVQKTKSIFAGVGLHASYNIFLVLFSFLGK